MTTGNDFSSADNAPFRLEWRDPYSLKANPLNPRRHPQKQRQALHQAMADLGWLQPLLLNERSGHLIDGHLRAQEAIAEGWGEVPVLVVDLDESQEKAALASLDAITTAAEIDVSGYLALLNDIANPHAELQQALQNLDKFVAEALEEEYPEEAEHDPEVSDVHLIPGESFHYVALLFRTDLDWLRAVDHFGVDKPALDLFHSKVVGKTRIIDGAAYLNGLAQGGA